MEKKVQGRGNARRGRVTTAEGWIGVEREKEEEGERRTKRGRERGRMCRYIKGLILSQMCSS